MEIHPDDYYRLVNTILFHEYERLPKQIIPEDEYIVTDYKFGLEIQKLVKRLSTHLSFYIPRYEFHVSPFNKNVIVPVISFTECSIMCSKKKEFNIKEIFKIFNIKIKT